MLFNRARAEAVMDREKLDAILLAQPNNFVYASGFPAPSTFSFLDRPFLVVLFRDPAIETVAIVPSWDLPDMQVRSWIPRILGYTEYATDRDTGLLPSWRVALAQALSHTGRIGVEERYLPKWILDELTTSFPNLDLVDALSAIRDIRSVKTPEEIERLRFATEVMQSAVDDMFAATTTGVTEAELGRIYAAGVASRGAENIANFVLGFGANGAFSHAIPGANRLAEGNAIRFDLGARYMGYHADTAVTRMWRKMSAAQENLYFCALESQRAAADMLRPGVAIADLYETAIRVARGRVPSFRMEHVGHGLGVEHHENPPLIGTSTAVLEANMVINVETLILDGEHGGFAIEDTYLITETGAEQWTRFDRNPVLG